MITSMNNPQVKNVMQLNQRAKARREQGLFVAEGKKMFGEAPKGWIHRVFLSETLAGDEAFMEKVRDLPFEVAADNVFRQMSDTLTPQGVLTVLKTPSYAPDEVLKEENPLVLVLEDLQDPGNAGTIFRTAEGAGVRCIFLTKTCVDVTNPKVIRSTMGSIYRMPFFYVEDVASLSNLFREKKIRTFAAHLKGKNDYDGESYEGGTAFFIGNEGKGLTEQAVSCADCLIRIPMCGQVESLNAAMAAGILTYEAARQRRAVSPGHR